MFNDFIALFVGAFNEFMNHDSGCYDWLLGCLIIVITACVTLGCFAVVVAVLIGTMKAFWRGFK